MSVKRYRVEYKDSASGRYAAMLDKPDGGYVSHEDYAALESRCMALAAENAGLKDEISNITFMRDDDFFGSTQRAQEVMGRLVNVKTPATDAFLAEVRAQGVESAGEYLKQYAQGLHEEARLVLQDAGELCNGFAAQLRKGVQS